jgi:ribonuclease HI
MRSQFSIYSAEQQAIITAMESTTRTNEPTIIVTDSLSSLFAASGNRWTQNPKTKNIRGLLDNSKNHIKLIWVPSHVEIDRNEAADQAAKNALNKEIGNQEPYPSQDLIKWMKKSEFNNRQKRWERG